MVSIEHDHDELQHVEDDANFKVIDLEQEASLATFLKVSASSWRLPEDATKANVQRF